MSDPIIMYAVLLSVVVVVGSVCWYLVPKAIDRVAIGTGEAGEAFIDGWYRSTSDDDELVEGYCVEEAESEGWEFGNGDE